MEKIKNQSPRLTGAALFFPSLIDFPSGAPKINADGALTRQLANEVLRARAAGRAFSSDVDVEQRDQDDAGGNDSHSDEGQCDAIGRRR
jgi:hypothetical protein